MAPVEQWLQHILPTAVSLMLSEHDAPKLLNFYQHSLMFIYLEATFNTAKVQAGPNIS
jgi:hypothetical protein